MLLPFFYFFIFYFFLNSIHVDGLAILYKGYWFEQQEKAWNEGREGKRLEAGEHVCRERHGGNCVFEEGDGIV